MSLEEVFWFVDASESWKRSVFKLIHSQCAEDVSSYHHKKTRSHDKNQEPPKEKKPDQRDLCSYCGKGGHVVRALASFRQKVFSAYGQTRTTCKRSHHLASKWRSSSRDNLLNMKEPFFDSLCSATNYDSCYHWQHSRFRQPRIRWPLINGKDVHQTSTPNKALSRKRAWMTTNRLDMNPVSNRNLRKR